MLQITVEAISLKAIKWQKDLLKPTGHFALGYKSPLTPSHTATYLPPQCSKPQQQPCLPHPTSLCRLQTQGSLIYKRVLPLLGRRHPLSTHAAASPRGTNICCTPSVYCRCVVSLLWRDSEMPEVNGKMEKESSYTPKMLQVIHKGKKWEARKHTGSRCTGKQKHLSFFVHEFEKDATSLLLKTDRIVAKGFFRWIKPLYSFALQSSACLAKVTSWVSSLTTRMVRTSSLVYAGNNNRAPLRPEEMLRYTPLLQAVHGLFCYIPSSLLSF